MCWPTEPASGWQENCRATAALVQELVDWLNGDDGTHLLVRAAMAHLHLVSIHPWADGNGRMSRSLQTLMIAREGALAPEFSSVEAWLGRRGSAGPALTRGRTHHGAEADMR
jgi:Fic family protein